MAGKILRLFPNGVPTSEATQAITAQRTRDAEELRTRLLDAVHTHEVYGETKTLLTDDFSILPTPDTAARRFSGGKGYGIYEEMRQSVLYYGALINGRIDLLMSLPSQWLPGKKGDAESERAAELMNAAWDAIDDKEVALRALAGGIETGFAPAELVYDVISSGPAAGMIAPVAIIDRPVNWFQFDRMGRPIFKPDRYLAQAGAVDLFKVMFLRYGSLHTMYGRGEGQDCYPAVYAIQSIVRFGLDSLERFGYPVAVITYPSDWRKERVNDLEYNVWRTWKNYLSFPGDVAKPEVAFPAKDQITNSGVGEAQFRCIGKFEYWLSMRLWGAQLSAGNAQTGSFARDLVHDGVRLEKSAGDGSSLAAVVNRGFGRPVMLANMPQLERSKWPRWSIDAAPNDDLRLLSEIASAAAKLNFPVSKVWWTETFNMPPAVDEEDTLKPSPAPAVADPNADPNADPRDAMPDPAAHAARQLSEAGYIAVADNDGNVIRYRPADIVYTENRGAVRASALENGDTLVVHKRKALA